MSEVIAIASGKGGVGKSVIAASLAIGLAQFHKKTILLDLDLGLRSLDLIMGMGNMVMNNLMDLVKERCTPEEVMIRDDRYPDLFFVAAAQAADKESITPEDMKRVVEQLRSMCDYIIIDCPSGIERGFRNAIAAADLGLLVVIPEYGSVRSCDKVRELMSQSGITRQELVINRVVESLVRDGVQLSEDQIVEVLGLSVVGCIPEDVTVIRAVNQGESLLKQQSPASTAVWKLVSTICPENQGNMVPAMVENEKKKKRRHRFGRKL